MISEQYKERALELLSNIGLCADLEMQLISIKEGDIIGEIKVKEKHLNFHGTAHGGAIFALADTISGFAVSSMGRNCTTINASINYLRPFYEINHMICHAKVIKMGKTCAWVKTELKNEKDVLCATADFGYFLLEKLEFE